MTKELEDLKKIIKKAGLVILSYYQEKEVSWTKQKQHKDYQSPVTKADLLAEKIILAGLKSYDYGILAEETSEENLRLKKERVWIIDPLDGTKDFLQKTGEFSIMVGLVEKGQPILGAVYQPTEDKLYYAQKGQGAYLERDGASPVRLQVSNQDDFTKVRMLISRNHLLETEQTLAKNLNITNLITCGSAGLKVSKIAEGEADLYLNTSDRTGEWDTCAADIILHEAGGLLTDMHGRELVYNRQNPINLDGFVATNGVLHQQVIQELGKLI